MTAVLPPPPVYDRKPLTWPGRSIGQQILVKGFNLVVGLGVTVGYHRHATHRAFWARRGPRVARADPIRARHGVLRGQVDISARMSRLFDKPGWVSEVRWTGPERLGRITARG